MVCEIPSPLGNPWSTVSDIIRNNKCMVVNLSDEKCNNKPAEMNKGTVESVIVRLLSKQAPLSQTKNHFNMNS